MSYLYQYAGFNGARQFFWYQNPADFDTALMNLLPAASASNYGN
jgi:hypothetical protein